MREKRNIKLRTDMYEDTKFKIIDTMAERDTINYIWTRLLTLCGKVNDEEGRLFVTKNMPYTIEILAVEFNRTVEQVENAVKVFVDLNMVSKDSCGVLKICNWCKYQCTGRRNQKAEEKQNIDAVSNEEDNKPVEDKENIIDISNVDLVKDKKKAELDKNKTVLNIKNKKSKVRKKKKSAKSSDDIACIDEDEIQNEIIEFKEPAPIPKDCKSVAVFNFHERGLNPPALDGISF